MLKSLKVSYLSAKSADRSASGDGSHLVAAQPIFSWWFAAATVKTKSYVVVAMGKAFFAPQYSAGMVLVPERFPPLRDRLPGWTNDALYAELGRGYKPPLLVSYPQERDEIIVGELLARGRLDDRQLGEVIRGPFKGNDWVSGEVVNIRLISLIDALRHASLFSSYASALKRVLLDAERPPASAEMAYGNLMGAAIGEKIDCSDFAIELIRRDLSPDLGLSYLRMDSQNPRVYAQLEELAVRPALAEQKRAALDGIRRRLKP
jgi:hypothetical protein